MQKKISIFKIKKYLNKKGFIVEKKKIKTQESGLDNLSRTFLSSLIIISIFFIAPLAINLTKEKIIFSKDYENNSKNNLKRLLENRTIKPFLFKYFFISKIEFCFCMPILQPLLLPQVNNDTKDFAHLALKSLLS